jgi:type 2 lantibiotic biosynthesis protein LanM
MHMPSDHGPAGRRLLVAATASSPERGDARFLSDYDGGTGNGGDEPARRLAEWQRATHTEDDWLDGKLASLGLDRAALLAILAGRGVAGGPLSWRSRLSEILAGPPDVPEAALIRDDDEHPGERAPFWGFLRWFLAAGARRLRDAHILAPSALADLLRGLAMQLGHRLNPTLVLELHRAELHGNTSRARYEAFAGPHWDDPTAVHILLDGYPVLARVLSETVDRWAEATIEMLARFEADRPGRLAGRIARVKPHLSDPHHGNRAVAIFEDEDGRRVVYKPRSLAVDERFSAFVDWLNARGIRYQHRLLASVDRGAYGWMEYAAAAAVPDEAAGTRFYHRLGSLLALLYFLRGQDFHYQNVVAIGEHPVFLDLEAILAPRFPFTDARTAEMRTLATAPGSVLETGLLMRPLRGPDGRATDLSGFGGGEEQKVIRLGLVDVYTDRMRVGLRERSLPAGNNRPRLHGSALSARDHVAEIVAGFRESYDRIATSSSDFAARLHACADLEVRFIPRHTQRYGILVQESCHPDYLRDALDTEMLLDVLHFEAHLLPALLRIIPAEQIDLRQGDFPRFTARPGERHLYDARGGRIDDFFERGSLEDALERLFAAGDADCERQAAIISAELGAKGGVDAAA